MSSDEPDAILPPVPIPPPLRFDVKPDRGRSLFAARPIKPGEIVLTEAPLLLYPSSLSCLPFFCCRCFRVLPSEPLLCPACRMAFFCSERCRTISHPYLLCNALPSLLTGAGTWPDDLLFLLSAYSLPTSSLRKVLTLQSGSQFPADTIEELHSELSALIPPIVAPDLLSPETTSSLISKEKNNSFSLMIPLDSKYSCCGIAGARAYGIYILASLFNHDCLPNVNRFDYIDDPDRDDNTSAIFRAFDEIKEGSEICINYVGVTRGYRSRQRRLSEYYGFKCECDRCKYESQRKGEEEEEEEAEDEEGGEEEKEEEIGGEEIEAVTGEGEMEMLEEDGNGEEADEDPFGISEFFKKYLCECGGYFSPLPPSDDGEVQKSMECCGCGVIVSR